MAPRFCGTFKILERIGIVAYWLALPLIVKFHDVFHVSLLKKYVQDVDHVIEWFVLQVEPKGEFQLELQCILQRNTLMLPNRAIEKVKEQWKHFGTDGATWEMEGQIRDMYHYLFVVKANVLVYFGMMFWYMYICV